MALVDFREVHSQLDHYLRGESDYIANTANVSSILWHAFVKARGPSAVNWVGFYVVRRDSEGKEGLVLGPFMGKPACRRIAFGKGVCGTAAATGKTQLVRDVHQFEGHIACDDASNSEIVVPVFFDDTLVAVLDMDCPELNGFHEEDQRQLERVVERLGQGSEWTNIATASTSS